MLNSQFFFFCLAWFSLVPVVLLFIIMLHGTSLFILLFFWDFIYYYWDIFCFGLCLFLFHLNTHFLFDLFSSANQYIVCGLFDIQYTILCLWMALHGNRTLMQNDIKSINQKNCVTYFSGKNFRFFCTVWIVQYTNESLMKQKKKM